MSSKLVREFMADSAVQYKGLDAVKWLVGKEVQVLKYEELEAEEIKVRHGIVAEGFTKQQISIVGFTSVEWIEAYLGIATTNNTAVPLDAQMKAEELYELIDRSDSAAVFLSKKLEATIPALLAACPKVKKIWLLEGEPETASEEVGSLAALKALGEKSDADAAPTAEDIAMIIFTSGTTGKSKGVMLSQGNLAENVKALMFSSGAGVPLLNVLPIHHAFCLVMDWLRGFANGAVICINDSFMHMVRNMGIFQPVSMLMVPLMIETVYKRLKNADPNVPKEIIAQKVFGGKLKLIFAGGAHLDPYYIEKFKEYGVAVMEGYGMSECSPVISANVPGAFKPGSVGKPLSNVELKFEDGEILVRGSSVMKQYYKMPNETNEALKDGWLHTGDKGYLDEDGFLFINGRIKNLIILSNGENISPEELENKLALNELIGEVIITGENNGLKAHIYPDPDTTQGMDETELTEKLQAVLDEFNSTQPTYRRIVGLRVRKYPFIKNATRKIKRTEIDRDEPV